MPDLTALISVKITNKNYGSVADTEIFVTKGLKEELENKKKKDGTTLFSNLENRGFQGGKHLIELLKNKYGTKTKLILTPDRCSVDGNRITINYNSFIEGSRNKFFLVYRETGLEAALEYLETEFPNDFPHGDKTATNKETKKVIDSFERSIIGLPITKKTKLIQGVTEIIPNLNIKDTGVLKELQAAANQSYYKNQLKILSNRLTKKYPETKGHNSWQEWIYKNIWLFGTNYFKALPKKKVGFNEIPDYLFLTTDGFLDVLEIKVPNNDVIKTDVNHTGSYYWDSDLSKTIGQVINYLYQIELHQLEIPKNLKKHKINILAVKPRAIILIGRSNKWKEEEKEAFRKLNFSLHGIEVLTYDNLLERGNNLIKIYDKKGKSFFL